MKQAFLIRRPRASCFTQNDCITSQIFAHRRSADRERRSGGFCGDYDGAWNRGPKQGGFHRDVAASAQEFAWPRDVGLSLRPHLSGIRGRAALATHRRNRCPRVASLVSTLVAALATARF